MYDNEPVFPPTCPTSVPQLADEFARPKKTDNFAVCLFTLAFYFMSNDVKNFPKFRLIGKQLSHVLEGMKFVKV